MFLKRWLALLLILAAPILWAQDSCSLSECRYNVPLDRSGTYIAVVTLPSGQAEGLWSLIINPGQFSPQYLNGFWAGSVLKEQSQLPSWVAFSLSRTTPINITPYDWIGDGSPLTVQIDKDIGGGQRQLVYGPTLMNQGQTYSTQPLDPGFYITGLLSQPESVRTYRGLALEGHGLFGGVVGGYLDSFSGVGYGAFIISSPEIVEFLLVFGDTFGSLGASQPQLDIYYQHEDGTRELSWSGTTETNRPPTPGGDGENTTNPPESGNGEGETTNPPTDSTVPRIIDWGTPPILVTPTTNEEADTMWNLGAEISGRFMNNMRILRETMDANTAIQRAVDDLKNDPDVVAVEYEPESLGIYTRLNSVLYIFLDAHYRIKPAQSIRKTPNEVFLQTLNTVNVRSVSPFSGNRKALIFSGFQEDFKHDLCPIKNALERAGFSVDFVVDIDMCGITANKGFNNPEFAEDTFHYIEKLHEYDVIYFDTHASIKSISLGIPYDPDIFKKAYINQSRLSEESEETFVGIGFEYIGTHFTGEKRFKNTLVFVEACNSARRKEFSFAEAFLENGAAVYIGFSDSIPIETSEIPEFVLPFFDRMAIPGTSVKTAFENPSPLPTYWEFKCTDELRKKLFGCYEGQVERVVYRSEDVDNDPEGFVLVKENLPPTAHIDSITGSDGTSIYYTMDVITFKGSGTDPEGQPITKYTWYFGDGSRQQEGQTVTNIYTKPGTYQVELWVMDSEGGVSAEDGMLQKIVVVEALSVDNPPPINQPPIVTEISGPSSVPVDKAFEISYTYFDPDGISDIKWYRILTSEGRLNEWVLQQQDEGTTKTDQWITKFDTAGENQWIEVSVEDFAGNKSLPTRHYINVEALPVDSPSPVENGPPVVLNLNAPGTIGLNQEFSISYNYFDPDGIEDVKYHYYFMSDMLAPEPFVVLQTGTELIETSKIFFFKEPGLQWIEVYVEDFAGNISQSVRKNIEVVPVTDTGETGDTEEETTPTLEPEKWYPQNSGVLHRLNSVIWNGSIFLAVGGNRVGEFAAILTSSDGINWTQQTSGIYDDLDDVTWNGSIFVAVGESQTVLTSPDGINWTNRTFSIPYEPIGGPVEMSIEDIVWNGKVFVISGAGGGDGLIYSSSDAIDWTLRMQDIYSFSDVIVNDDSTFIAVGSDVFAGNSDGSNWTELFHLPIGSGIRAITKNSSIFVAVGSTVYTSTDASNWTKQTWEPPGYFESIAWNGSHFIAVGKKEGALEVSGIIYNSPDGINWTEEQVPDNSDELFNWSWLKSVTCNQTVCIAVGFKGSILRSQLR